MASSSHAARIAARRHTFAVAQRARDRYESVLGAPAPAKPGADEELDLHGQPLRPGQLGALPRRRLTISRSLSASANLPMYFPVTDPVFVHTSTRDMAPGERIHSAIDEFRSGKYQLASSSTQVEVLIVATMYAEDEQCMRRTMHGIAANVRNLTDKDKGPGLSTVQIAVLIIADGREKMPEETVKYLQHLHIYEPDVAEDAMEAWEAIPVEFGDGRPTMHMFENTVLVPVESDSPISVPVNVTLAVKEANAGKLDSHHWALQAFAGQLEPTTVVLIDVGTAPGPDSITRLYEELANNDQVAGCCGEITPLEIDCGTLLSPVQAAQLYEYKTSHIMDKALESLFGFITVLPGAFCAYRYEALTQPNTAGLSPLDEYLKTRRQDPSNSINHRQPFLCNMYLAEDRILCFELVRSDTRSNILSFVHNAPATTDVPTELVDLLRQRRRWINGSFFAMIAVLRDSVDLHRAKHSKTRLLGLYLLIAYFALTTVLAWFVPANLYLGFYLLLRSALVDEYPALVASVRISYVTIAAIVFVLSVCNNPKFVKNAYFLASTCFGGLMVLTMFLAFDYLVTDASTVVAGLSLLGLVAPLTCSLLFNPLHTVQLLLSMVQYYVFVPTYVNIFMLYAMCNTHDVSWGTKGLESSSHGVKKKADEEPPEETFKRFRSRLLLGWVVTNGMLISSVTNVYDNEERLVSQVDNTAGYMNVLFIMAAFFNLVRVGASFLYIAQRRLGPVLAHGARRATRLVKRPRKLFLPRAYGDEGPAVPRTPRRPRASTTEVDGAGSGADAVKVDIEEM